MAVIVAAVVRAPWCSETSISGLLFRDSSLYHDRTNDDRLFDGGLFFCGAPTLDDAPTLDNGPTLDDAPTLSDAPTLGDAPILDDAPRSHEKELVLDDVLAPPHDISEISDRMSRVVGVVF